jgi:hypothetical protein
MDKQLTLRINKELKKLKQKNPINKWESEINSSEKKKYKWLINT